MEVYGYEIFGGSGSHPCKNAGKHQHAEDEDAARVVIGMATCGIAAGARPVMLAFMEELQKRNLQHVTVSQTGCIGMCRYEPMLDVILPGKEKVTYIHVKPEMVPRIVSEHIVNGRQVEEYTIGAAND